MSDDQQTHIQTRDRARERERLEYGLAAAQYERWRELLAMPTAHWPAALQARVRAAIEREGQRRDAVLWAVAAYVRMAVPTRKESR